MIGFACNRMINTYLLHGTRSCSAGEQAIGKTQKAELSYPYRTIRLRIFCTRMTPPPPKISNLLDFTS